MPSNLATTNLSSLGSASYNSTPIIFQNQSILNAHPAPPPVSTNGTVSSGVPSPPVVRRFNNAASGPSGAIAAHNIVPSEVDALAEYVLPIE